MSKTDLKEKIFHICNSALQNMFSEPFAGYICPICFNGYTFEDIKKGILTLEHVPPRSIGGKGLVLTCKSCNSIAGYSIDRALNDKNKIDNFLISSNENKRARLEAFGERINIVTQNSDSSLKFTISKNINDPKIVKEFEKKLVSNNYKFDFKLTPSITYNSWHMKVGYLKSAFLLAFVKFGYSYALGNSLVEIRNQILNYKSENLKNFIFFSSESNENVFRILQVKTPIQSLIVQFCNVMIVLPWFNNVNSLYKTYDKIVSDNSKFDLNGIEYQFPKNLELLLDIKYPGKFLSFTKLLKQE